MGIFDFLKSKKCDRSELASSYTDVHSAGFAFEINGRLVNLWEATNPKGGKEYFVMDHEICWNKMCSISNNHRTFRPDSADFVFQEIDLSEVYAPAKDVKKAWVYYTLV